ncbi:hypothetical protein BDR04DRAFT_1119023 [Suillus decipiens]|nr:hypothetical protein BDR04DRAFT_1119023 [Suillus decipiens]
MLGSFNFGTLMAGTRSLDEGSAPPVGWGSPEAMPTVAKGDGGRRLFDTAVVILPLQIGRYLSRSERGGLAAVVCRLRTLNLQASAREEGGAHPYSGSHLLLPADDELALDTEVVLSCAFGRLTMRSACTGAAGTSAANACETLGGVTVDNEAGEGIGDKDVDAFGTQRLHPGVWQLWVTGGRAMSISFPEKSCSVWSSAAGGR